jgi:O-antigen/teichoic acid export membrane protein
MSESRRQLLSIGVFFIILVVAVLLVATNVLVWTLMVPLVLVLFGVWILALAAMRGAIPQKYERSPFSTMAMGLGLIVLGGAWFLFSYNWLYSLALILLAFGAIAIASALRRKK